MATHSSTLDGKSHGWRSLVGCSPWGCYKLDMTEWLHFHFSLSCIGEGNGKPLQCSCLENPRDGGAWWAAVSGVTQSWTLLKWLSSSSSKISHPWSSGDEALLRRMKAWNLSAEGFFTVFSVSMWVLNSSHIHSCLWHPSHKQLWSCLVSDFVSKISTFPSTIYYST